MKLSGIAFIFSNVYFEEIDLPFMLSENMILRSATSSEIEQLNEHLKEAYGSAARWVVPFNEEAIEVEDKGTKKIIYAQSNKTRCWVIAFNGSNSQVFTLGKVSTLINPKLQFGSTFMYKGPNQKREGKSVLYGGHSQIELLAEQSRKVSQKVSTAELQKLKNLYNFIGREQTKYEKIEFVLELYSSSGSLDVGSKLLTLSLFSIIESLIAHKPRLTETLDSVTHQIKHKINLLSKRFDNTIKYHDFFEEIGYPKLWAKLYGLRSDIAHGQKYDFSKDYKILKSIENVNYFLDQVAKELIKLSIKDFDLVNDIRNC
ncbi:hypothetical protein [Pseudoalteromonas distincta]|uniref:hypothetical protein n=1 Tax=Pseudoalteromonas distincta TaxID=77608 RepID=UPI0039EC2DB9